MSIINRSHKDRLFRKLFDGESEDTKKNLLSLYNALNRTDYSNPDELTIYTIEDVVYVGVKNDVSCIIDSNLSLYEHQSTVNPNMPIRRLTYFSKMYERYIAENHLNTYGERLIKIPAPQYYVFYNGDRDMPDRTVLRLSDAFERPVKSGEFQWTATVLNINSGHNVELLEKCRILHDYQVLVDKIREYRLNGASMENAVDEAVGYCLSEGILEQYLLANKAEATDMLLTDFDEEQYINDIKEYAMEQGRDQGIEQGTEQTTLSAVQNLMKSTGWSSAQALDALGVSGELRQKMEVKLS